MKNIVIILRQQLYRLFLLLLGVISLYVISTTFLFASFNVSSDSMYPELRTNEKIVVFKPTIGGRLFNPISAIRGKEMDVYRMWGMREIRRNDVVVFNYPYKEWNRWNHITMNLKRYYVKRCIGLPGDSIYCRDGIYRVLGTNCMLGNLIMQNDLQEAAYSIFPRPSYIEDCALGWDISNWGPIYVPQKGDMIEINNSNYNLYKKMIEWEGGYCINSVSDEAFMSGRRRIKYRFKHSYFFMAGDNAPQSIDSRFWGLVPDIFIVGKVAFVIGSNGMSSKSAIKSFFRTLE